MTDESTLEVRPHDGIALGLIPDAGVGGRLVSFVTSVAIQGVAIAVLIIVPLMATDNLPEVGGVSRLMVMVPPPPPPPPPRGRPMTRSSGSGPRAPSPPRVVAFAAPVDIPESIGEGDPEWDFDPLDGVEPGVPGGVICGTPGCLAWDGPAEPAPEPEPVRVGGDVRPPKRVHYVAPVYPEIARQAGIEGLVILEAVIDVGGNVSGLRTLRAEPLLERAAVDAVRQWRYEPTLLNGTPVPIVLTVTVQFQLPGGTR